MLNKIKVFIVTEYIGFNHNSTAYYWAKIALHFNDIFDLCVICPDNSYTRDFSEKYPIKVNFVRDLGVDKNRFFSRVFGQIIFAFLLNRKILSLVKSDQVVITGTNPIISVLFTAFLKQVKGFKWMVVCHDLFPDNLLPSGIMKKGLLFKIVNKFFSFVYRAPDTIAPIGRDMAEKLIEKGVCPKKIHVVSNWADYTKVFPFPKEQSSIIQGLGWQDKIVFCFFGNMGRTQGVSELLDALASVKSSDARFLFIGDGSEQHKVRRFVENAGNRNSYYYGRLDLDNNNLGLNSGDIAIVSLSKGMYGLGVPSKAYFSMAADKPILLVADEGSELEILLREFGLGWFCKSGNSKDLSDKIDEICINYKNRKSEFSPRETLIVNFSEEQSLCKYSELAFDLIKK